MRGTRKAQMDLWKNHKPGDKESPQQAGPPAEDLWKNHKPGDKESPQQAGSPLTAGNTSLSFTPNAQASRL